MTADSELFVNETVCELLEKKIRKLIPRGCHISLEVPSGWWGIWDASSVGREKRHKFRSCKGLRSFYTTKCMKAVDVPIRGTDGLGRVSTEDIELLMGHRSAYYKPTLERLDSVYLKLERYVSLNPGRWWSARSSRAAKESSGPSSTF